MTLDPSKICFGLTDELDRDSLVTFLHLGGRAEFARVFAERLPSDEIIKYVDYFMQLLRNHLSEEEYHQLFLNDPDHHHHGE